MVHASAIAAFELQLQLHPLSQVVNTTANQQPPVARPRLRPRANDVLHLLSLAYSLWNPESLRDYPLPQGVHTRI